MQLSFCKYFSGYPRDKSMCAQLTSSNSIVGDDFILERLNSNTIQIKNKFKFVVAELDKDDSAEINLWLNKELILKCILTYVTYNEPKRIYAAHFLIIAFPKSNAESYENFCSIIKNDLRCGNRPDIKLDKYEHNKIIETNGLWKYKKLKTTNLKKGTVIIKGKMSFTEKLIEAGRNKNPGCYIFSIAFLIGIAALIIWSILSFIN